MMFSLDRKYVFIHVPKCAGTSFRGTLRAADRTSRPGRIWKQITGQYKRPPVDQHDCLHTHSDAKHVMQALGEETYRGCFSFAFVRNPWDRMLSMYNNSWQGCIDRAAGRRPSKGVSQEQEMDHARRIQELGFRSWLLTADIEVEKYGTSLTKRSQLEWVTDSDGTLIADHIGRVEEIADSVRLIEHRLQIRLSLRHANRSQHGHYRAEYCDETRAFVEEHFRQEVEMFGYTF